MSDLRAMQRLCGLMRKAVQDYEMIAPGDRVMVGVSGGKDSVALTIGLSMLRKYIGFDYEVVAVTLDPQFDHQPMDYSALAELFRRHGISYEVRRTEIGPVVFEYRKEKNPCALCAKLRRGALHTAAQELSCNKVALGHHLDDAVETFYMNLWREGRIGFALRTDFDAAIREMLEACALPGLEMTGLFQHFSVADDTAPENVAYTAEQHALFVKAFHALKAAGREPALVHCDNSAGVMLHPDWPEGLPRERCMARPGIILYGYDPSDEVRFGRFKPVMTLKTVVSMIKEMQPGQCASYGRRFTAEKPTKVATLCTGYADGYPRLLSCGKGVVEIHGKACPVLGRVCMDQMMVDVTDVPEVREDDEAILWGGTVSDTAETIARKTDTISYEVLCGVSRRVPRVYRDHGQIVAVEDWILEA